MTKKALLVTSQPNYPVTAPIGLDVRVHHLTEVVELYDVAKDIRSQCGELAVLFVDINLQDSSHTDGASTSGCSCCSGRTSPRRPR